MTRVFLIVVAALALALAGTASAGGPPVPPVGVGSGLGCGAQCIKEATVVAGPFAAVLNVRTDTPARISVKVSDIAPLQATGGPHFYTWDAADSTGGAYTTQWSTTLLGLQAGTLYHIVVWATDAEGRTAYQQGTFRTKGRTVEVTFWKVKVLNDADKGKLDKGEISFVGKLNGQPAWSKAQKKLASGATFHPHDPDVPFVIEDAPRVLELWVGGSECDDFGWEECVPEANDTDGCNTESDCADVTATLDLDQLGSLGIHTEIGTGMPGGHDGYVIFETDPDFYLEFRVYAFVDISWE